MNLRIIFFAQYRNNIHPMISSRWVSSFSTLIGQSASCQRPCILSIHEKNAQLCTDQKIVYSTCFLRISAKSVHLRHVLFSQIPNKRNSCYSFLLIHLKNRNMRKLQDKITWPQKSSNSYYDNRQVKTGQELHGKIIKLQIKIQMWKITTVFNAWKLGWKWNVTPRISRSS